jgi:hypothetical protein
MFSSPQMLSLRAFFLAALRQHRKLQNHHGSSSGGDGQKPLRDPRNQICAVHACILVD